MALQEGTASGSIDALEVVFDADFHTSEGEAELAPYLPDRYRERARREGYPGWWGGSFHVPNPVTTGKVKPAEPTDTGHHGDVVCREDVLQGMDEVSATDVMLTPGTSLGLPTVNSEPFAAAIASAFNDWILDEMSEDPAEDGIHSAVLLSPRSPGRAADEIDDRADERVFKAVYAPPGGLSPPLGDETYWPIYEAAERHGLPIMIHASAQAGHQHYPRVHEGMNRFVENHGQSHPIMLQNHLYSLLANGVPERFDVEFVFQESGIGWLPYAARRADYVYENAPEAAPALSRKPSEYVRERVYLTSQPLEGVNDAEYFAAMLAAIDAESTLLFSSDYPHFDFDNPDHVFQKVRGALGDEGVRAVFGGTAMEVFDI